MDSDNINVYLKPFDFLYETLNNNVFYIIKNKRGSSYLEYYDYKIKFTITNNIINIELFKGTFHDIDALKLIMIKINHYINNLTNKEDIVLVLQKGYRYNFITEVVKIIEIS
jgi:hypothetical protein